MNDQEWHQHIAEARQEDEAMKQVPVNHSDIKSNVVCALLSPLCLAAAFFLPPSLAESLVFSVWCLGGLGSLGVLAGYAYTDKLSYRAKEAALCFLLGNVFVFFVFLVKPT